MYVGHPPVVVPVHGCSVAQAHFFCVVSLSIHCAQVVSRGEKGHEQNSVLRLESGAQNAFSRWVGQSPFIRLGLTCKGCWEMQFASVAALREGRIWMHCAVCASDRTAEVKQQCFYKGKVISVINCCLR